MPTASVHERRLSLVALLISAGVLAWLISRGLKVGTHGHIDFFDFYRAAQAFARGEDIYAVGDPGYIYPPLLAFLMQPLTVLTARAASILWVFVNASLAAGLCALAVDTARRTLQIRWPRPRTIIAATITFIFLADAFRNELEWGNCNLIIMLPVLLAIRWLTTRPLTAGTLLAVAAALKYLPILFLAWLLARRRWRPAFAMVTALVALLLIPAVEVGWSRNAQFLGSSLRGVSAMLGSQASPILAEGMNAISSPPTAANILPLDAPYSVSIPSGMARVVRDNRLPPWALPAGVLVVAAACVLACGLVYRAGALRLCWTAAPAWLIGIEGVGVATAMIAFSPQTQKRHFNMLIALVAWGAVLALAPRRDSVPRHTRSAAVASLAMLAALTTPMVNTPWTRDLLTTYWNWFGGPSHIAVICQIILLATTIAFMKAHGQDSPKDHLTERIASPATINP